MHGSACSRRLRGGFGDSDAAYAVRRRSTNFVGTVECACERLDLERVEIREGRLVARGLRCRDGFEVSFGIDADRANTVESRSVTVDDEAVCGVWQSAAADDVAVRAAVEAKHDLREELHRPRGCRPVAESGNLDDALA